MADMDSMALLSSTLLCPRAPTSTGYLLQAII
jgi:hypothetical protein